MSRFVNCEYETSYEILKLEITAAHFAGQFKILFYSGL